MSTYAVLLGILGALLIGAISPGPSFVLVLRIAVTSSRANGVAAAIGMGIGGALFATLAVAGLTAFLMQVEWLYLGLKLVGGMYLIYLGMTIWRGARQPLALSGGPTLERQSLGRSFALGVVTQLSNPKTAIVYASIFAAMLPAIPPLWLLLIIPPLVFLIEAGWYITVAVAFSTQSTRSLYIGSKLWLDRMAGGVMGLLGARLIVESLRKPSI